MPTKKKITKAARERLVTLNAVKGAMMAPNREVFVPEITRGRNDTFYHGAFKTKHEAIGSAKIGFPDATRIRVFKMTMNEYANIRRSQGSD
jgi:hypothetical protein